MSRAACGNAAVIALLLLGALGLGLWQNGNWWQAPPLPRSWAWATLALLLYASACLGLWWRRRPRSSDTLHEGAAAWLVAWASQTGYARELAELTATQLRNAGQTVHLRPLEQVDARVLAQAQQALFIVSTTGEGDARIMRTVSCAG